MQPYVIVLAAVGASVVTNVTVSQGFDILTYIHRANPDSQLLGRFEDTHFKLWLILFD